MPQRRPHRKSRYGCDQCRHRRVKCDERPPRCSNCINRDEECHFSRLPPHPTSESQPSPQSNTLPHGATQNFRADDYASLNTSRSGSELPVEPSAWSATRLSELELMHHWCTRTYTSAGPQFERLFRDYIPREALCHDYLMAALLAFSSFHLASDNIINDPSSARQHTSVGLRYQNEALSGLRANLGAISQDNCSPVLLTAILIMACAIVSPLLPVESNERTQSTAEAILPLVNYMNAVESIKGLSQPWLANTPIKNYLDAELESMEVEVPLLVDELQRLNDATVIDRKRPLFSNIITDLAEASRKEENLVPWLVKAGAEFQAELRSGESMALAIYMHWGAVLDQHRGTWWAKFVGKRLVEELSTVLRDRGPEWEKITTWCRARVGHLLE